MNVPARMSQFIIELRTAAAQKRKFASGLYVDLGYWQGPVKPRRITCHMIRDKLLARIGMPLLWFESQRRHVDLTRARHVYFWLCREYTEASFPMIAALCGGRDHTTAIHGCQKAEPHMRAIIPSPDAITLESAIDRAVDLDWFKNIEPKAWNSKLERARRDFTQTSKYGDRKAAAARNAHKSPQLVQNHEVR